MTESKMCVIDYSAVADLLMDITVCVISPLLLTSHIVPGKMCLNPE